MGRRWEQNLAHQERTSLSRTIDPRLATNVAAVLLSLAAGAVILVVRVSDGWEILEAFREAFLGGLATFLTWALAREIDPDHQSGALLAGVLTFGLWFSAPASSLFLFSMMIVGRLLGRTTGPPPRRADLILALGVTGIVSAQEGGAAIAIVVAVALVINRIIGPDDHPWSVRAALAILILSGTVSAATGSVGEWMPIDDRTGWWVLLAGVMSIPFMGIRRVEARSDYTGQVLDVRRLRAVRVLVVVAAFGAVAFAGEPGLESASGVFAALAGVIVGKLES